MVNVQRTKNNMFPMMVTNVEQANVVIKGEENSVIWHMRYDHLSYQGLQVLKHEKMVLGLPDLHSANLCEACILGTQTRTPFPLEKA